MNYQSLIQKYPITTDQITRDELAVILRELAAVLEERIDGDIVELGCYQGTASLFMRRLIDVFDSANELHVYDSFAGLPPKTAADASGAGEQFQAGELLATKKQVVTAFKHAGLQVPHIHKGWFSDLTAADMPEQIAFAFLDGDFYGSIIDSLKLVWPRMQPGGVVLIDDYQRDALPGVKRAVEDFFGGLPQGLRHEASIAIIKKS